jgi:hypothetical protein
VVTPTGGVERDHVEPPFWVTMMEAAWPPSSPTATQVAELAAALGAQETAVTLVNGAKLAVVCHDGVTAAAGSAESWLPSSPMKPTAIAADNAVAVIVRIERNATPPSNPDSRSNDWGIVILRPPLIHTGGQAPEVNGRCYAGCGAGATEFGGVRPARTSHTPWHARRAIRVRVATVALPM